jgi:hypothetical protein
VKIRTANGSRLRLLAYQFAKAHTALHASKASEVSNVTRAKATYERARQRLLAAIAELTDAAG